MRHEEEEKRAKQMLREEEGTGRKGRLGIDLASGVVVIGANRAGGSAAEADTVGATGGGNGGGPHRERHAPAGGHGQRDTTPASDAAGSGAGRADDATATPSPGQTPKPGEPQVAHRSPGATPEGKARRRSGGPGFAAGAGPVGKARRTHR